MKKTVDDRSAMAKAMSKVSEIISICLMMIVPALLGYWLDQRLEWGYWLTFLGFVFGMAGAVLQLMSFVSSLNAQVEKQAKLSETDRQRELE